MRIFLDANVLFSAAKSAGAVRQLLHDLHAMGHALVADEYVATEARRNLTVKASSAALEYLSALLTQIEVSAVQYCAKAPDAVLWLPEKDRPVLQAAMALRCDALVTGDRSDFGPGYEQTFAGVTIYSPAQLALLTWRNRHKSILDLVGILKPASGKHVSVEEMNPWR